MPAGQLTLYNAVAKEIGDGSLDMDTQTFKATLHTSAYAPNLAQSQYSDLTNELATANGYTNGGATLTGVTWNQTSGVCVFESGNVTWTAAGGSISARYLVLRSSSSANQLLIGYMLLDATPADVVVTSGNDLVITPDPVTGWFTNTVNP
jgi:hypothetical protein